MQWLDERVKQSGIQDLVGGPETTVAVIDEIKRVAEAGATVPIDGESGTGRERAAEAIHTLSTIDDLGAMVHNGEPNAGSYFEIPRGFTLEDVEKAAIRQTLGRFGGNRTQTAQSLGISVRTLQRKLKRWQSESDWNLESAAGRRQDG